MTNDPHSPDLDQIKSLLAKSFDASEGDDIPPLPESLRDRINGQYGRTQAHRTASSGGFFATLTRWIAQPAFAGASVAIILALVAVTFFKPQDQPSTFRGDPSQGASVTIALYQIDAATEKAMQESGYFDEKALRVLQTPQELAAIPTPKIVIDGSTSTILLYSTEESEPSSSALPTEPSQLPDLIAELLRTL